MDYNKIYNICHSNGYMNETEDSAYGNIFNTITKNNLEYTTVLDVGCSIGNGVLYFNNKGKECTGLDVSDVAVNMATKRGLDVHQGNITKIPMLNDSYDLVVCTDVLEHLIGEDIQLAIDELFRVSKKYVALNISNIKETSDVWAKRVQAEGVAIDNLHLTVTSCEVWRDYCRRPNTKLLYCFFLPQANCTTLIYEKGIE